MGLRLEPCCLSLTIYDPTTINGMQDVIFKTLEDMEVQLEKEYYFFDLRYLGNLILGLYKNIHSSYQSAGNGYILAADSQNPPETDRVNALPFSVSCHMSLKMFSKLRFLFLFNGNESMNSLKVCLSVIFTSP